MTLLWSVAEVFIAEIRATVAHLMVRGAGLERGCHTCIMHFASRLWQSGTTRALIYAFISSHHIGGMAEETVLV